MTGDRVRQYIINNPQLMVEWDWEKNNELGLDPRKLTYGSSKKVRWRCKNGHSYEQSIDKKTLRNYGCPICSHKKIGPPPLYENSIWASQYKEYASQYLKEEQMKSYMPGSMARISMRCPKCGTIKYEEPDRLCYGGFSCPKCSDGISFSNKFIYSLLEQLHINFISEYSQTWSEGRKYDFFLVDYNCIIENHGAQHYRINGFSSCGGRTLEDEQNNDKYKRDIAYNNGIKYYFELDCRYSDLNWIKKSITNSGLMELIGITEEDIQWNKCLDYAKNSLIILAAKEWNNGLQLMQIAKKLNRGWATVAEYLKKANELKLCIYSHEESVKRATINNYGSKSKRARCINQYDLKGNYIRTWGCISDAKRELGVCKISEACKGKRKTAGGYIWRYADEVKDNIIHIDTEEKHESYITYCSKGKTEKNQNETA